MKIMNSNERLKVQTGIKMVIFGPYGIGKTSLLKTINEPTLCLDFEAGLLAVQDWQGDSVSIRTWNEARDIACYNAPICLDHFFQSDPIFKMNILINTSTHI